MRVAVIGGGIAGIVAAETLSNCSQVEIFEGENYLGGHTNTVAVKEDDRELQIDTGFIVFNNRTYPNFIRLLDRWGVASHGTSMGFSVRCDRTGLEYAGTGINGLLAQRSNIFKPSFWRLIKDWNRFNKVAIKFLAEDVSDISVADFFSKHKFSNEFIDNYFLPMGSAVWSCPRTVFMQFPIRFLMRFYKNHGLLSIADRPKWRVITGGSQSYVRAFRAQFRGKIHLASPIQQVRRHRDGVSVITKHGNAFEFDHVIFACHSNQALRILGDEANSIEREILSQIPYEKNIAQLHTDTAILPSRERAWASWNYRLPDGEEHKTTVTYNMNILQGFQSKQTYCVSLNCENWINPNKVIRTIQYEHPIFSANLDQIQARHNELIDQSHTSFCGAYWRNGFHEDGVVSGLRVARKLIAKYAPEQEPVEILDDSSFVEGPQELTHA